MAVTAPKATAAPTPKKMMAAKLSIPHGKGFGGAWLDR
jgi:hypothetical protein